ncbi:endopeptidase [Mycobacteroides abscessus subsp. abscessus]|uniref:trypsin-like serine protease n=1 Tax=Mycobacteroides abscessus TaxID=36809 RepID=UPI00092A70BF|nr:trypsin-like serine protease [Mycobacteroides abscessus]SIH24087.1 endopeptidase [Mycobacteroides abscessus subsp. abscessus]
MKKHVIAIAGAAAALMLAVAPSASAGTEIPVAWAVAPGVGLGVYDASGHPVRACTMGFLAHDVTGQEFMLSAGHCDGGGEVDIHYSKTGGYENIGSFVKSIREPNGVDGEGADVGLVKLNGSVPADLRVIGIRPITGSTSQVAVGDSLCHFGYVSSFEKSAPQCGHVTEVSPTKVVFDAPAIGGDSGGPVYKRNSDGTATAVGITIRGDQNGTVAELAEPWLRQWGLTLDVARGGPVVTAIGYPSR